jgi:membrane complex biogenesis BtpA family protein
MQKSPMQLISEEKPNAIREIFRRPKAIIGVVHCRPFPGSPNHRGEPVRDIYDAALRDAEAYIQGGVHGMIIENHGDIPFLKPELIGPETASFMAVIADRIRGQFGVPIGINVLANAAIPALAIAYAAGASFVRVNQWANAYVANEGIIEGAAATALRYRAALRADSIRVFADSHVKHGSHAIVADRSVPELTRDVDFFQADCIIATGQRTGHAVDSEEIDSMRSATRLPILVGSGATKDNVGGLLERTDGVIVASSLKREGVWWNPVERARVEAFMEAARPRLGS